MLLKRFLKLFKTKSILNYKIGLVLLSLVSILLLIKTFQIETALCYQNNLQCAPKIFESISALENTNYIFVNKNKIRLQVSKYLTNPQLDYTFDFKTKNLTIKITSPDTGELINIYFLSTLPMLSLYDTLVSSSSSIINLPTVELFAATTNSSFTTKRLWENGYTEDVASGSSKIKVITTTNLDPEKLKSFSNLIKIFNNYLHPDEIYFYDDQVFLSRAGQPDIIVLVTYNEERLRSALQSLEFISQSKRDVKIIDLRFKNPVIR